MSGKDWYIFLIIGGVFVILGIGAVIWGIIEEKRIFEALSKKPDLREFTLKHLESPQPGALKIGGWIAIGVGVLVAVAGIVLKYTNWFPQ
jgi:hypothetical protein